MTGRVLVVVSSYRPAFLADMQRARMLAWELPRLGWEIEILAPAAREIRQDVIEAGSGEYFPSSIPVHEVEAVARGAFDLIGSRSPAWRTLLPAYLRGRQLLGSRRFDLVYFSTTSFAYFILGPLWARSCGVPYVLDFHDPWVKPQFPGALARIMEKAAVRSAAGLVAVSPKYLEALRLRYETFGPPWLAAGRHAVIPFGAREDDFQEARRAPGQAASNSSNAISLAYVGAGGRIMVRSFTLICRALAALRATGHPAVSRVRIDLLGTTYGWREGDPKLLEETARGEGVGDLVRESPQRVSYRSSLEVLLRARGAIVLGVDDDGYMPSKLFAYALSGKPLLASLRRESPAFALLRDAPGLGHALWFDAEREMPLAEAAAIMGAFIEEAAEGKEFDRRARLDPWLAPGMARRHAELFDACIASTKRAG